MDKQSTQNKLHQCQTTNHINPWIALSIFDFSYFCCPECDYKSKTKQDFVNHASGFHDGVSLNEVYQKDRIILLQSKLLIGDLI